VASRPSPTPTLFPYTTLFRSDLRVVVDAQPRGFLHRALQQRGAAESEGGVDLVLPVAGDVDEAIARQADHRGLPYERHVHQDDRVRAALRFVEHAGGEPIGGLLVQTGTGVRAGEQPVGARRPAHAALVVLERLRALQLGIRPQQCAAADHQEYREQEHQDPADAEATPWCAGPACAPGTATARLHALRLAAGATPVGASARPARGLRVLPVTLRPGGGRARGLLVRATRLGLRVRRAVRALLGSC